MANAVGDLLSVFESQVGTILMAFQGLRIS